MNFFTGFLVGVVSLIPGISGGTILVLLKQYENVASFLSNFKEKKNQINLLIIGLGIILGAITFARIIEFCFYFFPSETLILFGGFVLFSLPGLIKTEQNNFSPLFFIIGMILMGILGLFSYQSNLVIENYPTLNISFLLFFTLCGTIDGFFTILPGISGSMVMMILGPYFLYKSYLANLSLTNIIFLIPLTCYFLGDILGLFFGGKFSLFCLKKNRKLTISLLLGMVFMSVILILPSFSFKFKEVVYYLIFLIISYLITKLISIFT